MKFEFEKVTDSNLVGPSISIISYAKNNKISTSKLIKILKKKSVIPDYEKDILKNRNDDKFSQKIRNLISHKTLEKYNLATISNNNIELNSFGKKVGNFINKNFINSSLINVKNINQNPEYKKILLMAKLKINFDPIFFQKIKSLDFSTRTQNVFKKLNIKFVGDIVNNLNSKEILRIPNSGRGTLSEIEEFLLNNNLKLGMQSNWNRITNKDILTKLYTKNKINNLNLNLDDQFLQLLVKNKKQTEESFERQKKIILSRFAIDGNFSTLESIAKQYGITRERVRQIQKKFADKISEKDEIKQSIKRLIKFIGMQTPLVETVLSELLIKENYFNSIKSIPALRSIISSFEKYTFDNYSFMNLTYNQDDEAEIFSEDFLISNNKQKKILGLIITHSRKRTTKYSYCNFNNLISDIFKTKNFSKYINIKESLKRHENFLWFDENNFITLDSQIKRQRVLNTLKKLLYIQKKISFEDFREALLNNVRIGHAPPIEFLQKICEMQNLKFDNDFIYYSGDDYDLGELDKSTVALFKENNDFLGYWECVDLSEKYGININSLNVTLYAHSTVKKLDNQIFCLFGTKFDQEKYDLALERSKKYKNKNKVDVEINWTESKNILLEFNLSKSIKLKGFINLPSNWLKILEGSYYCYNYKSEIIVGGAIWSLNKILNEFNEGDKISLLFSFEPRTVKINKIF